MLLDSQLNRGAGVTCQVLSAPINKPAQEQLAAASTLPPNGTLHRQSPPSERKLPRWS